MNFLKCQSCGEIYISRYLHCCRHHYCFVSRINRMSLNYGFSAKELIQKTLLFDEVNQQSISSNSAFNNSNSKSASASEASDASALSNTYEANRNIVPRNDVQFYRPWLMGNVNPGFPFLSQNEGYAIPSMSQRFGLLYRPVCLTPIRNENQMRLEHTSNNDKEPERPANIQTNEILRSKYKEPKRREKNPNEEYKSSFPSTSRKLSENPPGYEPAVAGPSRPRHVGHICPVCRKEFPYQSLLKRHSMVHSQEKPFVCDVCQKSFAQKCDLKRHMLSHKGIKPFKCQQCGKAFTKKYGLNRHMLFHLRIKSYKCRLCGKAFTVKDGLKSHMRTHTGEKPFKCDTCEKKFSKLGNLHRHVLIHKRRKPVS